MGKLKSFFICAAALCCPILICTETVPGSTLRASAYFAAGAFPDGGNVFGKTESESSGDRSDSESSFSGDDPASAVGSNSSDFEKQNVPNSNSSNDSSSDISVNNPITAARVIDKNRTDYADDTDFSKYTKRDGVIYRYAFEKSTASNYINLESGAQVRNVTSKANSLLEAASKELPDIHISDPAEPTVLIYHSHTTESFLPKGDKFDKDYPTRSRDESLNMVAVGDAICKALAERGVSSVHDCTIHDYPQYTGSYGRSEKTILDNLKEYPSIKLVIDIHRDGIVNPNGTLVAPVVEIGGRNAAQFMIISGCDCEAFSIPHYLENFRLACLLQNTSEKLYPNLARSVLFDYREYNQRLFAGTLLIEVGSHGNSPDEVAYTGELLGEIIAESVKKLR